MASSPSCETLTPLKKVLGFWSLTWPEVMQMELGECVGVEQKVPGSEAHLCGHSKSTVPVRHTRGFQSCLQGAVTLRSQGRFAHQRMLGKSFAILDIMNDKGFK